MFNTHTLMDPFIVCTAAQIEDDNGNGSEKRNRRLNQSQFHKKMNMAERDLRVAF